MTDEIEKSKCCTCGFEWVKGRHGGHSCSDFLLIKISDLEADKERLDWLDGNRSGIFGVSVAPFDVWLVRKNSGDVAAQGTIRNAIDKARK